MVERFEIEPILDGTSNNNNRSILSPFFVFCHNLYILICAHLKYYQHITVPIAALLVILGVIFALDFVAAASTKRHRAVILHDYTSLVTYAELQLAKVDHWCLSGNDDDCKCDDPSIPISREQKRHWIKTHKSNNQKAVTANDGLEVVLLGDASVEEWNGKWLGETHEENIQGIQKWYGGTFQKDAGGDIEGLALGIAGDSIANLFWRIKHGEMPTSLKPNIWWISIGANDLERGECAEEVVLLGILRLAEEISTRRPGAVVVINSILPRLDTIKAKTRHGKNIDLWPSIQIINQNLQKFCQKHGSFRFFDASPLFFQDKTANDKTPRLKPGLLKDHKYLTLEGHKVWGRAIVKEVKSILFDAKSKEQEGTGEDVMVTNGDDDDDVFGSYDELDYNDDV